MKNLGFHFTIGMKLQDGQELIVGKEYVYEGEIKICRSGYHLSRNILNAFYYAPGFTLSLVEFDEVVDEHKDKLVCRRRKVIETRDVREIILTWAYDIAEDSLNKFWNNSDDLRPFEAIKAVREYIQNPSDAAANAARAAADAIRADGRAAAYTARGAQDAAYSVLYATFYAAKADIHFACAHIARAAQAVNAAYSAHNAHAACDDIEVLLIRRLQKVFKNNLEN